MITFSYTILYVQDVEATLSFYEKAFGFTRKFITPDNSYGELLTGATTLSFAKDEMVKTEFGLDFTTSNLAQKPFGIEVAFATQNVPETFDHAIANGAVAIATPSFKPYGQTVAYVCDINGLLIEICTPME
jgi:lactoylglutathione lyase